MLGAVALALATVVGVRLGVFAAMHRNRLRDYAGVALRLDGLGGAGLRAGHLPDLRLRREAALVCRPSAGTSSHGLMPGWLPPAAAARPAGNHAGGAARGLPGAHHARRHAGRAAARTTCARRAPRAWVRPHRAVPARLRNAAIPILTVIGPIAGDLITGSFIIEQLFPCRARGACSCRASTRATTA